MLYIIMVPRSRRRSGVPQNPTLSQRRPRYFRRVSRVSLLLIIAWQQQPQWSGGRWSLVPVPRRDLESSAASAESSSAGCGQSRPRSRLLASSGGRSRPAKVVRRSALRSAISCGCGDTLGDFGIFDQFAMFNRCCNAVGKAPIRLVSGRGDGC